MKFNVKSLLKDKNVLRIVAILSVFNLLGYLMMQNLDAVAFFVIIGFLTTYFSKNMIVVLLVAMITTNFLVASRSASQYSMIEGMKNKGRATTSTPSGDSEEEEEKLATGKDSTLTDAAPVIDQSKTIEEAYNNLDKLIGSGGISEMTKETQKLMENQRNLKEAMKDLPDMMNSVQGMMKQMGGMEGMNKMLENLSPAIEAVNNITGGAKKGGGKDLEGFAIRG